jgi:hypothetical protein
MRLVAFIVCLVQGTSLQVLFELRMLNATIDLYGDGLVHAVAGHDPDDFSA